VHPGLVSRLTGHHDLKPNQKLPAGFEVEEVKIIDHASAHHNYTEEAPVIKWQVNADEHGLTDEQQRAIESKVKAEIQRIKTNLRSQYLTDLNNILIAAVKNEPYKPARIPDGLAKELGEAFVALGAAKKILQCYFQLGLPETLTQAVSIYRSLFGSEAICDHVDILKYSHRENAQFTYLSDTQSDFSFLLAPDSDARKAAIRLLSALHPLMFSKYNLIEPDNGEATRASIPKHNQDHPNDQVLEAPDGSALFCPERFYEIDEILTRLEILKIQREFSPELVDS
jgi:hypothetical protein